jgi:hypothetical protein
MAGATFGEPSDVSYVDVFGERFGPPKPLDGAITAFTATASLFANTGGELTGFTSYEPLVGTGQGKLIGHAGPSPDVNVVTQVTLGQGQILRFGLPQWSSRLLGDPAVQTLTRQAWTLLSQ